MLNVVLVGYDDATAQNLRTAIDQILLRLGKAGSGITTRLYAETKWCDRDASAPYIIVRNTDIEEAKTIRDICTEELNVDGEAEQIDFKKAPRKEPQFANCHAPAPLNVDAISDQEWAGIVHATNWCRAYKLISILQVNGNKPITLYDGLSLRDVQYCNKKLGAAGLKFRLRNRFCGQHRVPLAAKEFYMARV